MKVLYLGRDKVIHISFPGKEKLDKELLAGENGTVWKSQKGKVSAIKQIDPIRVSGSTEQRP